MVEAEDEARMNGYRRFPLKPTDIVPSSMSLVDIELFAQEFASDPTYNGSAEAKLNVLAMFAGFLTQKRYQAGKLIATQPIAPTQ